MQCVELELYFFYEKIVHKYLFLGIYNLIILYKITQSINMVSKLKLF